MGVSTIPHIHPLTDFFRKQHSPGRKFGGSHANQPVHMYNIIKIKIHFRCEIEDIVETHLCKLCVILHRAYYWVCVLIKDIGRRLHLELQCSLPGSNRVMLISLCAETIKPYFEGDKI